MGDKDFQLDLQELVENYVWDCFTQDLGCIKRLFHRRHKYYFDIRWGFVDFSHVTTTKERATIRTADNRRTELYFSHFDNKSNTPQMYTFSTERSTTATTSIEMQENYTIGSEANLEINLADVVKVGGGVNGSLSVTDTKCEEFSETLTWNINTEITVPAWNTARATLYVYEEPSVMDIQVTTTISLPKGSLPVSIRRTKDDKVVKTYWITNLKCIFTDKHEEDGLVRFSNVNVPGSEIDEVVAVIESRGVCKNVSWKNQHVEVQCALMDDAPTEARSAKNVVASAESD
ncbi:uncharacterized protein LOC127858638 [Dreissena polymorpha]|uniref:Uncharacterized protein n=1 Tax=Dreissena polymorpha TaxID=45954 RepID=A0A9D3YZC5_DREPO|nr:uncharacterized protein LOC127858638 [Dreissena polymorpha]XP_052251813.1 uncharacterized protein LOC127858638 [Dreissena polymorpha]KAH3707871.1 hypothetical protein DPMN_067290 [Dreissena polymorpha]